MCGLLEVSGGVLERAPTRDSTVVLGDMCATSGRNGLPNLNLSGVLLLDLLVINWP